MDGYEGAALENQKVASKPTLLSRDWDTDIRTGAPELWLHLSDGSALLVYWLANLSCPALRFFSAETLCAVLSVGVDVAFDATPLPEVAVRGFAAELTERAEAWVDRDRAENPDQYGQGVES